MKKIKFNTGWNFYMGSGSALQTMEDGNPEETAVTLPHDASILRPRDSKEAGGSGNGFFREENYHYIKEFQLPAEDAGNVYGWNLKESIKMHLYISITHSQEKIHMDMEIFMWMLPNMCMPDRRIRLKLL